MPRDERALEPRDHELGGEVVGALEEDGELVAADPAEQVAGAEDAGPAAGDLGEQPVAGLVAVAVVHVLEAVEIEQDDAERPARAPRAAEGLVERPVPGAPVREPGQLVDRGELGEPVHEVGAHERDADHRGGAERARASAG